MKNKKEKELKNTSRNKDNKILNKNIKIKSNEKENEKEKIIESYNNRHYYETPKELIQDRQINFDQITKNISKEILRFKIKDKIRSSTAKEISN